MLILVLEAIKLKCEEENNLYKERQYCENSAGVEVISSEESTKTEVLNTPEHKKLCGLEEVLFPRLSREKKDLVSVLKDVIQELYTKIPEQKYPPENEGMYDPIERAKIINNERENLLGVIGEYVIGKDLLVTKQVLRQLATDLSFSLIYGKLLAITISLNNSIGYKPNTETRLWNSFINKLVTK